MNNDEHDYEIPRESAGQDARPPGAHRDAARGQCDLPPHQPQTRTRAVPAGRAREKRAPRELPSWLRGDRCCAMAASARIAQHAHRTARVQPQPSFSTAVNAGARRRTCAGGAAGARLSPALRVGTWHMRNPRAMPSGLVASRDLILLHTRITLGRTSCSANHLHVYHCWKSCAQNCACERNDNAPVCAWQGRGGGPLVEETLLRHLQSIGQDAKGRGRGDQGIPVRCPRKVSQGAYV